MNKKWLLVMLAAGVVACSSASGTDLSNDGLGGDDDSNASDDSGSSSGSSSGSHSGSSSGSHSGSTKDDGGSLAEVDAGTVKAYPDAAPIPTTELGTPVELKLDAFDVPPGGEVYKCQQFGNPFNGKAADIVQLDGYMSPGSHHFFLFNMDSVSGRNKAAPFGDCPGKGIEFHPFPYLSQTPGHFVVTYPSPEMGYPIATDHGLMINVHYLNTSSKPLPVQASIKIWPANPGFVKTHVGTIFENQTKLTVAWGEDHVWHSTTNAPGGLSPLSKPYTIFSHWSHMHKWATDFQMSIGGTMVYEEPDWGEPRLITAVNDPLHKLPIQVPGNTPLTWKCQYTNNGSMYPKTTGAAVDGSLTFGDSAQFNVMCIYMAQYYPAQDGLPGYPDVVDVLQ